MSGEANTVGTVHNLRLRDGTNLTLTQTVAGTSSIKAEYTVNVDRFEVFATVDGNPVTPNASITLPTPPSRTAGATAVTELNSVVFPALTTGETFIMAGLTFTSGTGTTSEQLAAAFASITPGEGFATVNSNNSLTTPLTVGAFTAGTVAGWSSGASTASTVVFTSSTAFTSVSDLASTGTRATAPTINKTEGVAASASMVFNALAAGQKLTMAGLTFTAGTSGATAAQVAAAFASITAGQAYTTVNTNNSLTGATTGGVFTSGTAAEWSTGTATAATVVFTCTAGKSGVTGLTSLLDPEVGGIADASVLIEGSPVAEQQSIGVMGFIAGKNIDSLSLDSFGAPQFATRFNIDASRGEGSEYGQTINGGGIQLTIEANGSTAYSSAAQTYINTQDGSATSQLASYNVDSSGRLVAQYDNGSSVVKGQLILAYFNNLEGLIPNGNNTSEASSASGEPLLSFPGDGTLGAIRSKAVEQSNVDLTEELVKLMVLQRQYSAVSQATKVMATTLIDEAINIGR
jgi:flagellar hook-basal body protein